MFLFIFFDGYSRPTLSHYNRPASWSQWVLCIESDYTYPKPFKGMRLSASTGCGSPPTKGGCSLI